MASRGQDFSSGGQPQLKRDEHANHPSHQSRGPHDQSGQDQSYTTQATNFLQQTGEQVKSMAQGAAEAVKNTLGMTAESSPNPSNTSHPSNNPSNNPSNPSHSINQPATNPGNNPSDLSHSIHQPTTNPGGNASHRI
ncbi:uncharacterized protein LOC8271398 [Ricinus communis]|uniref:Uncharacterized protein n=1 Tax=Ricinus communis TaxID=3988 RepID=B9RV16_RICCO|nr:uncharacterized protein LOC8271398 [Ricinus communis]EEF44749.1 conserved hypothetical protein [Ricinus communis]|eukprot:XP_002517585.1 uncharacterized protein LOC8271398 [Ricinus communis]